VGCPELRTVDFVGRSTPGLHPGYFQSSLRDCSLPLANPGLSSWATLSRPCGTIRFSNLSPGLTSWATLSRPCGTILFSNLSPGLTSWTALSRPYGTCHGGNVHPGLTKVGGYTHSITPMRKVFVLMMIVLCCGGVRAQNIEGQIVASQYGNWKVPGYTPNTYSSFAPTSCRVQGGASFFFAFNVGTPITIVDSNPYTKGGEFDQTINTGLTNVSDAGANSLAGALQSQARRTGQNSAADAATAASAAQQNTRNLSSDLAQAQQSRIAGEAGYNQAALGASALPISANQSLYGTSSNAADSLLGDETQAAKTPSFWDEVGNSVAGNLGKMGKL